MKTLFYGARSYDRLFFEPLSVQAGHTLRFLELHLNAESAQLVKDETAVCAFVNDHLDRACLEVLAKKGVRAVVLRCAGFNNVDLEAARDLKICVGRVPRYSPHAVAEHAAGLLLAVNRKIHRAYNRVRESNFSLDGLLGFDLYGKTVGVVGTGAIGTVMCRILRGFGCEVLAHDRIINSECVELGVSYVPLSEVFARADVLTFHCPLTPETHHMVNAQSLAKMKSGVVLVNTSRGGLIDAKAVIQSLKKGHVGALALDVYEEEEELFFEDLSEHIIQDDVFSRLMTFPNVLITGHQAFFTVEALKEIARVTLENLTCCESGQTSWPEGRCLTSMKS